MRFFLDLSYNGQRFHGWQSQSNAIGVQQVVEDCLSSILGTPTKVTGAGRTDTGVHALQMIAHFDAEIMDSEINSFMRKGNSFLGRDIKFNALHRVKPDANARFDAVYRTYKYFITSEKDVFNWDFCYYFRENLDYQIIHSACEYIKDFNDFKCFAKSKSDVKNFLCKISGINWTIKGHQDILTIKSNRFLRGMVRCIAGTLIELGRGRLTLENLRDILVSGDRKAAGYSVPAKGLFLTSVEYPSDIFLTK
ncbi:MAG: tRNA pseudouridine(38-40) synthase TruA [Flavobacteriaceae bacterium]|nr:tRNA pseudouridine(38-40) synthase TruA [Flavobacteriaceae bacterium]